MMILQANERLFALKAANLRYKSTTFLHTQANPLWTMNSARVAIDLKIHFDYECHGTIRVF